MRIASIIQKDNFNDIFMSAFDEIYQHGIVNHPRDKNCKEIITPILILDNPKNCLCTLAERKMNYAYLIIEKMMYLSQFQDPSILIAYNSNMQNFLNKDTLLFDGAYGERIGKNNQLFWCYEQLKKDKDTRQAIITIHNSDDCHTTLDNACTLNLNFIIREDKLNLITYMRSNDLLWGTCLDIPAFCFLQEVMAYWLGIEVGKYIHIPTSLHYYQEFEERIFNINRNNLNLESTPTWTISYEETPLALKEFWTEEENIRNNLKFNDTQYAVINSYLKKLLTYWQNKLKK